MTDFTRMRHTVTGHVADIATLAVPAHEGRGWEEFTAPSADDLEAAHSKAELVSLAADAGLDTSGNKGDIAARLAAHQSATSDPDPAVGLAQDVTAEPPDTFDDDLVDDTDEETY